MQHPIAIAAIAQVLMLILLEKKRVVNPFGSRFQPDKTGVRLESLIYVFVPPSGIHSSRRSVTRETDTFMAARFMLLLESGP